jgi:class 3 adenylate cyclase
MERKLVTIMAADGTGCSCSIRFGEQGMVLLHCRARRQSLTHPTVTRHGSRIAKTIGDGLFVQQKTPACRNVRAPCQEAPVRKSPSTQIVREGY